MLKPGQHTSLLGGLLLCAMVFARFISNADQEINAPVNNVVISEDISENPENTTNQHVVMPHTAMASMYVLESK